jgi:hypothetical protein
MLQIAVVGEPRLRIEIKTDLDVLILDLQSLCKTCEAPQRALGKIPRKK